MRSSVGRAFLGVLLSLCLPLTALAAAGDAKPAVRNPKQAAAKPAAKTPRTAAKAAPRARAAKLSVQQIVQKHLAARGGAQAWRGVQSMSCTGTLELGYGDSQARSARYVTSAMSPRAQTQAQRAAAAAEPKDAARKQVLAPFVLEMKRPEKSRIELEFSGKKAVQVYDGAKGWLLRPYLNRDDWEPFTADQAKSQRGAWELGGPLVDAAAKGTKVELVTVEPVEGRDAYELKLTRKDGVVRHVWIDAKTFLDVKVEGSPRRMDGKLRTVWVTQRDFRAVQGRMVPFVLETAVDGFPDTHRMTVEKVAINPPLDDARFTKPKA
jgi:hypothetical protein